MSNNTGNNNTNNTHNNANNNTNQGAPPPDQPHTAIHQSALGSFLAEYHIVAANISATRRARQQSIDANNVASLNSQQGSRSASTMARQAREERRKHRNVALGKIRKSSTYKTQRAKHEWDKKIDDDCAKALTLKIFNSRRELPGQGCNCEICGKRFTVTPYSNTGPDGGFVCPLCGKKTGKDEDGKKVAKRGAQTPKRGAARHKAQSGILDGTTGIGSKSLVTLCVETLVKNVHLADDLGDLAPVTIDRITRLLSKRRLLNSHTLGLFLQPHRESMTLYDAAQLSAEDFIQIFQRISQLKRFKALNAIRFSDQVMQYLTTRNFSLEGLYLHGANLLSQDAWEDYLVGKGLSLKELSIYYTDCHFGDRMLEMLPLVCPNLVRLKICHNQQVSEKGVEYISSIPKLEHLSLQLIKTTSAAPYIKVIEEAGRRLRSFSIRNVPLVDDTLLEAIHNKCTKLSKLRITDSEKMTDAGFVQLFENWKNKSLSFIDLEKCRYLDARKPQVNPNKIGLCSEGFKAMMKHSGHELKHLNIHACRHISKEAFEQVFAGDESYLKLHYIEVSFCEEVTDFIVGNIFRSCPNVKEVNVFGCMKVKDVQVPRGKILVGIPNANGMRTE